MARQAFFLSVLLAGFVVAQKTFNASNLPATSEQGQEGTNKCGTAVNQSSWCQNAYINSIEDFCLFAPPEPNGEIGNTERFEVAWCLKNGTGNRIIPDGTIKGVTFIQTPDYVQLTGIGDLTLINVKAKDSGGELDPHGADGNGNPIGGLVFSSAFNGKLTQIHEWTNFQSATEFCFRACKDGPKAANLCQHIYDTMGCGWNMPGDYQAGEFKSCQGDSGEPMGIYGGSTFHQGDAQTPAPHPAPSSSKCQTIQTVSNGGFIISGTSIGLSTSTPAATATGSASGSGQASQTASSASNNAFRLDDVIPTFALLFGVFAGGLMVII